MCIAFVYIGEDMELHHGLLGGVRVLLLHILKVDLDLLRYNVIDNMCITVIQSSKQSFFGMVSLHWKESLVFFVKRVNL